jgi:hypothetical protein
LLILCESISDSEEGRLILSCSMSQLVRKRSGKVSTTLHLLSTCPLPHVGEPYFFYFFYLMLCVRATLPRKQCSKLFFTISHLCTKVNRYFTFGVFIINYFINFTFYFFSQRIISRAQCIYNRADYFRCKAPVNTGSFAV